MGDGLKRVAKLCGGLTVTSKGETVHYDRAITDRNQFTHDELLLMAWLFEDALDSELIDARTKSELRICRVKFERLTERKDALLHGDPNETDKREK